MKHIRPEIATYPVLHESLLATREREPLCGSRAIITPCANPRLGEGLLLAGEFSGDALLLPQK